MSTTIALKDLSLQQVCNLLPNINFRVLVTIAEENEIDGLALDSVETLEDLALFATVLPNMKLKAFFTKITGLKETGVSPDLLLPQVEELSIQLPQVEESSIQLPQVEESSIQLPHFAADSAACIQYDELVESSIYAKCLPFLDKNITFVGSMAPIRSKLEFGPIGELSMVGLDIVATSAIYHGDNCNKNGIDISSDEIAALGAYTEESELYKVLNTELRSTARSNLAPFIQFIILLTRAIAKCPVPVVDVVYRAFKDDVSKNYITDEKITWAQLSSSTTNIKEAENFLSDDNGVMQGTLFIIELSEKDSSRNIQAFSTIAKENEVLFAPMSSFQVSGVMDTKGGLIIVHLRTIPSTRCLLKYVSLPSSSSSSSSSLSPLSSSSSLSSTNYLLQKAPLANWVCSACTFSNSGTINICELCGTNCGKAPQMQAPQMQAPQDAQVVKNFTFTSLFNKNVVEDGGFNIDGVLFYIGTKKYTQLYQNPHEAGYVVASKSSDIFGSDIKSLVGRTSDINTTADKEGSWMAVDLSASRSLIVNHFCLRYGWSSTSTSIHFPQNFELQGSNCGATWKMIQRFEGDTFNNAPVCQSPNNFAKNQPWAHWKITTPNVKSFRHFRILQFGPHQGGRHVLALSGLELYGDLTEK